MIMKKNFLMLAILMMPLCSMAQTELSFKFGGGFSTTKSSESHALYGTGAGIIGIDYSKKITQRFGIKTGIEYQWHVFKQDYPVTDGSGAKLYSKGDYTRVNHYLGIPVLASLDLVSSEKKWIPYIDAGVNFLVKFGQKVDVSPLVSQYAPEVYNQDLKDSPVIFGLNAGFGVKRFVNEYYFVGLKANYNYQINNSFEAYGGSKSNPILFTFSVGAHIK